MHLGCYKLLVHFVVQFIWNNDKCRIIIFREGGSKKGII
jgi:hypothetical protein